MAERSLEAAMSIKGLKAALASAGLLTLTGFTPAPTEDAFYDPLLVPGALCGPSERGQPALLRNLIVAATETAPFQPVPAKPALGEVPPLYGNLGNLHWRIATSSRKAQAYFDQGLILALGFNHAEAQRAFREAQKLDPACAMCYWGESLILGPNINVPMMPEANAPALAALEKANALARSAPPKERALIEALAKRYSADPKADRAALDKAYAEAMREVAARYPKDDTLLTLYAEALMDTQPWDYWEAAGAKPKGNGAEIVKTLETVLRRNPTHPGAAHLYIHAVEASTRPERALPYARALGGLAPGAGHLVHMPAHIYYRVGMYKESLAANKRAIAVDERYFATSPSDPLYKSAYYPHNIHFVMVSAQAGGDRATALEAADKLDASIPVEVAKMFAILQPVKAAPFTTRARFSDPQAILALAAPPDDLLLVKALFHYARAVAHAARKDAAGANTEIEALARLEQADFKAFAEWGIPAKEIVQIARLVSLGRVADAEGSLDAAAKAYEDAIFLEDTLSYMEPRYWDFPVRQALGSVRLRQGRLAEAEKAFRDSLAQVRNSGWALAGLAEVYKRKGDAKAERATRAAFSRAWFGEASGPDLARL
jgi:tetratricopeptide (TPR) repeat protein